MNNKVYFVGAGPGKPDLITVRGAEVIRQADVVIYDYLVNKQILGQMSENAELICCDTLGKQQYSHRVSLSQERINKLIIRKAKEGKRVVRLKNGDPSLFSRLSQELEALIKAHIEFEVVPGVTSASAASCFAGIPLTDRRYASHCAFVTGQEDPSKTRSLIHWKTIAGTGTVVLYMAVNNLAAVVRKMLKNGKRLNTPVAIIQDASLVTQKVLTGTLHDIVARAKKLRVKPPAIIIIGEVVNLKNGFDWFGRNKRILFTGLSAERFFLKGNFFHLPLIEIKPMENYTAFDKQVKSIMNFDWLIFVSRYGVEYFFKRLKNIGYDLRKLAHLQIAAIGTSTKNRLLDFGILADVVPENESSGGLMEEFKNIDINNKKILLPRSDISDKGLGTALENMGAQVTTLSAYRNVMPENLPDIDLNLFDEIMFTSPSTVRNFIERYKKVPEHVSISCIGKVTRQEAQRCRLFD